MKKHRKQSVNVYGQKQLVDVPVDDKLYAMDNREEYQRKRSKSKHISLDDIITADVIEDYEESQLLECLREALQTLDKNERQLIEYIYYQGFSERKIATILKISQPTVMRRRDKIIQKLRNTLIDWQ